MSHPLARAHAAFGLRRFDLALRECGAAHREAPNAAAPYRLAAFAHLQLDSLQKAIDAAREAVRLGPDEAESFHVLATVLGSAGRLDDAEGAIVESLRLDPHDADAHALAAALAACRGRWDEVAAAAQRGLALDPHHPECLRQRGRALRTLGRPDAEAALAAALAVDPQNSSALREYGTLRRDRGDADGAADAFLAAVRRDPTDAAVRHELHDALRARHAGYRWVMAPFAATGRWVDRCGTGGKLAVAVLAAGGGWAASALRDSPLQWLIVGPILALFACGAAAVLFHLGAFDRLLRGGRHGRLLPGFGRSTGFTWRAFGECVARCGAVLAAAVRRRRE